MTRVRVTLRDAADRTADAPAVGPGQLSFTAETRQQIGVAEGDAVTVTGSEDTVATVGPDTTAIAASSGLAGADVLRNVGPTDTVTVAPADPSPAAELTVAPATSSTLEGDADALARALAGRHLVADDRIAVPLFSGTVVVTLDVEDTTPGGPVTVTADTAITLTGHAADSGHADAEHATPADTRVGGLDDERGALRRLVVAPLVADSYAAIGVRPPAGVLVHGPAGTGKTTLVRAVAAAADLAVESVAPEDAGDRDALAAVLDAARDAEPGCVVFVESLAAAAPDPTADGASGRGSPSALGWLLDRVRGHDTVVVVGETTDPDAVDPALRRGGRFDAEVRVGVPDPAARRAILDVHTDGVRLADAVSLDAVADRTHGYTGADLTAVLVDAATRAAGSAAGPPVIRQRDLEAALDAVGPSTLRDASVQTPTTTYQDIGGLDRAKREVVRTVEWPQRYPALFERLDAAAPTGVLLHGPPGTGKTMLAKAVAASTDANFLSVDGPELMNRYVGESERGVRDLFERARRLAPAVVFLDEVDSLAPARHDTDTGASERVVSQLLTELDGLSPRGSVAVLAATNRRESVDPALLRPGRIETQVAVPIPDQDARAAIFEVQLDGVATGRIDTTALAAATTGYTGSDIAGVVREGALLAMEDHLRETEFDATDASGLVVTQRHLRRAIETTAPSVDGAG
ncbi:AAA family ATPase [Halobacterium salinarum]|uniref:Bacterioopsin-associated chaperone n=10 Tax=Halobacterium salinarum TaxID=2242 RepID=Q9HPV0_HALSA|nr:AAA family ATPase [Halobacterium salinarum]AAG19767.1 cell division cycle protein [Halobacterium salinarum NRC-1]MBB6088770.1 transitional endoplasmic reticulum ATPase [Halobacterium salinarum]MDL0119119.1 AAA family ATPase [Halobacterium salinarum]MDL0131075.1 AAA family ATPase [Halobacterium salinarum]QCC45221.1 bacterioopsin-associated chaperone [Halobacterium salinarum]